MAQDKTPKTKGTADEVAHGAAGVGAGARPDHGERPPKPGAVRSFEEGGPEPWDPDATSDGAMGGGGVGGTGGATGGASGRTNPGG